MSTFGTSTTDRFGGKHPKRSVVRGKSPGVKSARRHDPEEFQCRENVARELVRELKKTSHRLKDEFLAFPRLHESEEVKNELGRVAAYLQRMHSGNMKRGDSAASQSPGREPADSPANGRQAPVTASVRSLSRSISPRSANFKPVSRTSSSPVRGILSPRGFGLFTPPTSPPPGNHIAAVSLSQFNIRSQSSQSPSPVHRSPTQELRVKPAIVPPTQGTTVNYDNYISELRDMLNSTEKEIKCELDRQEELRKQCEYMHERTLAAQYGRT